MAHAAPTTTYDAPKIKPIPHVDDLVPGERYSIEIRTKTKKEFRETTRAVRLLSGEFVTLYEFKEFGKQKKVYAAFTGITIEDTDAAILQYDGGKLKTPCFDRTLFKPIFAADGSLKDLKGYGHQELDLAVLPTKTIVFDFSKWTIGRE